MVLTGTCAYAAVAGFKLSKSTLVFRHSGEIVVKFSFCQRCNVKQNLILYGYMSTYDAVTVSTLTSTNDDHFFKS